MTIDPWESRSVRAPEPAGSCQSNALLCASLSQLPGSLMPQSLLPNTPGLCPAWGQGAEPTCSNYSTKDGTAQLSTSWGTQEASPKITVRVITALLPLLRAYYMAGTLLSVLSAPAHSVPITTSWAAQRGYRACSRSHSYPAADSGFQPRCLWLQNTMSPTIKPHCPSTIC